MAFHCSLGLNSDEPGKTWIFSPTLAAATSRGDDLHHLVAGVALAAGKLVRGLEHGLRRERRRGEHGGKHEILQTSPIAGGI